MPSFLHPALFWTVGLPTLGVVAVPVLIHLINMMRHRRMPWAAMEFLLVSQKKNRTWVMLKQLLLLLLRMAAVAAIVLLVAQPVLQSQWGSLLGNARVHHIVLLDDSFSMSDRWEDTDAFSEAKNVVERIGAEAVRRRQPQRFTLLRFSQTRGKKGTGPIYRNGPKGASHKLDLSPFSAQPDLLKQSVGPEFAERLNDRLGTMSVTETAPGPIAALETVAQLLGEGDGEQRVVYLVSDFRTRQWDDPTELRRELLRFDQSGAEVQLVDCVDRTRPNLAIVSLKPADGIRAAGVPWFMEVGVRNFGPTPVRDVSVILGEDGHGRPAVTLAEIPPGKIAKERFLVHFPDPGPHEISARLESDAVDADNHRYYTIDLPADVPVLLVDGDPAARDARYMDWALAPGGAVRTGIRPQIESPRYLGRKPLEDFATVNLMNVDRLDAAAVEALENYVTDGGGVAFFLGEHTDPRFFSDVLYRSGNGLFPVPLARPTELIIDRLEPAPDVQVGRHFIFRLLAAERNPFLQTLTVERYYAVPERWRPAADSSVRVVARLRNGAPLALERPFGRGRVLAFLTTAAPTWNNWARSPSFVVIMQDLQAYLSQRGSDQSSRLVGAPLELTLDPAVYQPQVRFTTPQDNAGGVVDLGAAPDAEGMLEVLLTDTDQSGLYEAQLTRTSGSTETRRYALNVDPSEGDLKTLDAEQLAARLEGVPYKYEQAAALQSNADELRGYDLSEMVLYGLVLLLILEQILAWSAGYHPARRRAMTQGGAA